MIFSIILLSVISDIVWQALIAAVVTVILAYMQSRTQQSVNDASKVAKISSIEAANEIKTVKQDLAVSTKTIANETVKTNQNTSNKVEEVKQVLAETTAIADEKLTELTKITLATQKQGEAIHTLVNSNMGIQLKISAVALRRIADMTQHTDDIKAAQVADDALAEHNKKQEIVDKST